MSLPPNPYSNSIPSKPTFALPARPNFEAPASWDIRKQNPRQPRAPSPTRRRDTDTYRPRAPTPPRREVDRYVPEDSSERNQRTARDSYIPSGEAGTRRQQIDSYRPEESNRSSRSTDRRNFSTSTSRSPEKRDRDRSPSRTRDSSRYTYREDHRDSCRDATELATKSLKDRINQLEPDTKLQVHCLGFRNFADVSKISDQANREPTLRGPPSQSHQNRSYHPSSFASQANFLASYWST
jgi:hypothetical protein